MHYHNHKISVTEKRAPTDESIRIYKELKTEAENAIIDSIQVNNNTFNGTAVLYKSFVDMDMSYTFHCKFVINNKPYKVKTVISEPLEKITSKYLITQLYKHVSEQIAKNLLSEHLSEESKYILYRNF